MKKKSIGIFVCMFLLISSFSATITAIESTAIIKKEIYSSPIPDEDTLKNAIIERIEVMQSQNYNIKFIGLNWTVTTPATMIVNMTYPTADIEINESDYNNEYTQTCNVSCDAG